jgi:CheY-like chemotaxis protein
MSSKQKSVLRVLFVDDNPAFLDMVERVFCGWAKESWQFLRANNAGKGMTMLEEQMVDLLVIDLHMPGLDGRQFLRLVHRRYANLPKVVMTGQPDEESKKECLSGGAELFLEKPKSLDEMEAVFSALNGLANLKPDSGFRGMMRQITLSEVLQLECLNKNSSVLEVSSGTTRGQIFVQDGNLVHAQGGGYKGQTALSYLLSLKGGEFNLRPSAEPPEITMSGSWEGLLMEAAQASDEGGTAFLRGKPRAEVMQPLEPLEPLVPLPPLPTAVADTMPLPDSNTPDFSDELLAPQIREMLVCSAKADVLYQWQCPRPERRIELIEILGKSTQQLNGLLGAFDRLDCRTDREHVIVQSRKEGKTFLHVLMPAEN